MVSARDVLATKSAAGYKRDVVKPLQKLQDSWAAARGLTMPRLRAGAGIPAALAGPISLPGRLPGGGVVNNIEVRTPHTPEFMAQTGGGGRNFTPLSVAGHEMAHGAQVSDPRTARNMATTLRASSPTPATVPEHDADTRRRSVESRLATRAGDEPEAFAGATAAMPGGTRHPEWDADTLGNDFASYAQANHPEESAQVERAIRAHSLRAAHKQLRTVDALGNSGHSFPPAMLSAMRVPFEHAAFARPSAAQTLEAKTAMAVWLNRTNPAKVWHGPESSTTCPVTPGHFLHTTAEVQHAGHEDFEFKRNNPGSVWSADPPGRDYDLIPPNKVRDLKIPGT